LSEKQRGGQKNQHLLWLRRFEVIVDPVDFAKRTVGVNEAGSGG
jgi:hypothetical protein